MSRYRICKSFIVESGHMLSRHPERCRFPHGHTRRIEVVITGDELDENGMLLDFKALKLALQEHVERYDHAMAISSLDPRLPEMENLFDGDALIVFENEDPTTEVMARDIFEFAAGVLESGFVSAPYRIEPGRVRVERVRVSETPTSWAEYGG